MRFLTLILAFLSITSYGQNTDIFRIDSLPTEGVLLDKGWKFHAGDNPEWAKSDFDDSAWGNIDLTKPIHYLPQIRKEPVGWFRIKIHVDSSLLHKPLAFYVFQSIASEIYKDGSLLKQFGIVSQNKNEIKSIQPLNAPVGLQLDKSEQVFAVRFSVQPNLYYSNFVIPFITFRMRINDVWGAGQYNRIGNKFPVLNALYTGLFIVLTIIHFGFFLFHKNQKANLFFALTTLSGAIAHSLFIIIILSNNVSFRCHASIVDYFFLFTLYNLFLLIAIYHLFSKPRKAYFWFLVVYSIASAFLYFVIYERSQFWAFFLPFLFSIIESLRVAYNAYRQKFKDAIIIVVGLTCYLICYTAFNLILEGFLPNIVKIGFGNNFQLVDLFYQISTLGMPLALSIYFFRNFAFTSKNLEQKLNEIQQLSAEKQQILANQNELLEKQVQERTAELKASQNQLIQKEKLASLGELTAGIAHEIQNPLNFVNNFSELSVDLVKDLKDELNKTDKDKAYIDELFDDLSQNQEKINHHGKRASNIVKGMLEHSRTSTGERVLTDINALCDEYLRLSYHGMRAKNKSFNADFKTEFDPNLPHISIVSQDIGRVLLNLFNNAFYAVNEKRKQNTEGGYQPTVSISTMHKNDFIEIKVTDNGNGIPDAIKEKIFQPFFTTKPTGEGTGLGLSLSYDIVTNGHGGSIEMLSTEGVGSEFILKLPI